MNKANNEFPKKSTSCFSHDNKPLTNYLNEKDAQSGITFLSQKVPGQVFLSYKCPKCPYYHVKRDKDDLFKLNKIESNCKCTDHDKGIKGKYATYQDAEKMKTILFNSKKLNLKIYQCPNGDGFHLTSHFK